MLTVLMTTHNRAQSLESTLSAFCRLETEEPWKVVVVDNDSVDATQRVLSSFQGKLPLTHIIERQRGKNAALNTGLAHIEGDIVIFTDDDVNPRSDWLLRLRDAATREQNFGIFGGSVLLEWEVQPDPRLTRSIPLGACFSMVTRPDGPCAAIEVFGPNMAVRSEIIQVGFRFNPTMGPDGSAAYAIGGETEFLLRLEQGGHRAWHCQNAVVRHTVRAEQMTVRWLLARAEQFGRGRQRLALASLVPAGQSSGRRLTITGALALCRLPGAAAVLRLLCDGLRFADEASVRLLAIRWWLHVLLGAAYDMSTSESTTRC